MNHKMTNFELLAKPTGSNCNINCDYCFYLEKEHLYPERKNNWKMNYDVLVAYVKAYINSHPGDTVNFIWQGGEPTLAGIEFFERAVDLQHKYANGKKISNSLQTNGLSLSLKWANFLRKNNFLVGISIDGNEQHHDHYRKNRSGKGTYQQVIRSIDLLNEFDVEFNTLTVVSDYNAKEPLEVYESLKAIGSRYMQFIPLVERIAQKPDQDGLYLIKPDFSGQCAVTNWSVQPKSYGSFLNAIFDSWAKNDIGQYFVMNFEQTMNQLIGGEGSCVFSKNCGANLAIESNGDIYSCDHYVYPGNKLGNIMNDSLFDMVVGDQQQKFSSSKQNNISSDCLKCPVLKVCNGGCPKHRFMNSTNGIPNKNYLCDGFYKHFYHVVPRMKYILNKIYDTN
ncbi:sulfatase maturase [Vibrio tubiashii]|nr:sulfatase maturase [Vibrio tubiashii]